MYGKSILKISATLLILMLSTNTFAGGYWAIGGGTTSWDLKPASFLGAFELENGATIDMLIGSRQGNMAFEGEFTFSSHDWVDSGGDLTHNALNLIIAGLGYLPINETFELYGKIGLDFWSTTVDVTDTNYEGDDGMTIVLGGGANLNLSESFGLRLEYKMMGGIGDGLDEGDISQTTLMAVFKF
jgi:Outer membrane protein beta-barrel domain